MLVTSVLLDVCVAATSAAVAVSTWEDVSFSSSESMRGAIIWFMFMPIESVPVSDELWEPILPRSMSIIIVENSDSKLEVELSDVEVVVLEVAGLEFVSLMALSALANVVDALTVRSLIMHPL